MWVEKKKSSARALFQITRLGKVILLIVFFLIGFVSVYSLRYLHDLIGTSIFWSMITSIATFTTGIIALIIGFYPSYDKWRKRPMVMVLPYVGFNGTIFDRENIIHIVFSNWGKTIAKEVHISLFLLKKENPIELLNLIKKHERIGDIRSGDSIVREFMFLQKQYLTFMIPEDFNVKREDLTIEYRLSGENFSSFFFDINFINNEDDNKIKLQY